MFAAVAVDLSLLRTVDPTETDAFRVLVVQDFDGVAVKDADDLAGTKCPFGKVLPKRQ